MNSTPSRYETIFGESAVAPSPGLDYDETAPNAPSGPAREYGVQIAQPDIYSYAGRPGVEYLVTAEYDEDAGEVYDGNAITEHVESKLTAFIKGMERTPEEPEILKKWIGPVTQVEFKGGAGNGILGRVQNGLVKLICYADVLAEDASEGEGGARCLKFEEMCLQNGLIPMHANMEGMKSMVLLPKCYNVGFAIGQTNHYFDVYASEDVHKAHEFRMYVEADSGKYIPAGGDEFKNKTILMCTLELDELTAMFKVVNQKEEEEDGQQPWLTVGEVDGVEEKLIVSDSGAKFLFAGLPPAMHRAYGERFNEGAL